MSTIPLADRWEHGNAYERYVGRWSRRVAAPFLDWLDVPPGRRWLDVGCGTGALCAAIVDRCAPSMVAGVDPAAGFLESAQRNLAGRAQLRQGSAMALPVDDDSMEVVVSALVLNFVDDVRAALREMARVALPGGTIGAYVWDYAGRMDLMRHFWEAAVSIDPGAARLDEGVRFPLCRPDALRAAFEAAGLTGIDVTAIDIETPFRDFDDYWSPFLGGQGPAPGYAMSLDEPSRSRLRELLRSRLPVAPDGTIPLVARAWAIRANVPAASA